ncbi:MAG TPA: membrane protein insertion efficiency factor YidD [Bacteroidetes bacterium]|nr:membrane protein insertion efficiency factor YidD [Bacteroidota bacterium]
MRHILVFLVRGYQIMISPYFPSSCRYQPTCSQYAIDALKNHGALKGTWLTTKRILRCHPWAKGGHDPVPPAKSNANATNLPE